MSLRGYESDANANKYQLLALVSLWQVIHNRATIWAYTNICDCTCFMKRGLCMRYFFPPPVWQAYCCRAFNDMQHLLHSQDGAISALSHFYYLLPHLSKPSPFVCATVKQYLPFQPCNIYEHGNSSFSCYINHSSKQVWLVFLLGRKSLFWVKSRSHSPLD